MAKIRLNIEYAIQPKPEGIGQAFLIAEEFIENCSVVLALGDNLFHGNGLAKSLQQATLANEGSDIFVYPVKDPERYGVVELNKKYQVTKITEKPQKARSKYAVTGLYFYDKNIIEKAKQIKPSKEEN